MPSGRVVSLEGTCSGFVMGGADVRKFWAWLFVWVLCFALMVPEAFAASVPAGLVVKSVVADGGAYDVTIGWWAVAGATGYKAKVGAGEPDVLGVVLEFTFEDVAAGSAVYSVCSTDGGGDSEYASITYVTQSLAGSVVQIGSSLAEVATEFMTEGTVTLYVVGLAVAGFAFSRVLRSIRRRR